MKIFRGLTLILVLVAFACVALAEDPPWPVAGKTATLTYEGSDYKVEFASGPFGPRDNGTAIFYADGAMVGTYKYYEAPIWIINIEGLARFKYVPDELIWIQGPLLVFKIE